MVASNHVAARRRRDERVMSSIGKGVCANAFAAHLNESKDLINTSALGWSLLRMVGSTIASSDKSFGVVADPGGCNRLNCVRMVGVIEFKKARPKMIKSC